MSNGSRTKRRNKGDVKHDLEYDSCYNQIVCSIRQLQAFFEAKLCSACLLGNVLRCSITLVRRTALYPTILLSDLLYMSDFLSKRNRSSWKFSHFNGIRELYNSDSLHTLVNESASIRAQQLESGTKEVLLPEGQGIVIIQERKSLLNTCRRRWLCFPQTP